MERVLIGLMTLGAVRMCRTQPAALLTRSDRCAVSSPGRLPTVVSPDLYRGRFCEAMDKYFLMVPDHWAGLGMNC